MIRFAPIAPADALRQLNEGSLDLERQWYKRDAFKFLPAEASVPLVVDHNVDKRVGTVRSLFPHPDTDGEWVAALCDVTDPPDWLRRNTPASFKFITLLRHDFHGWNTVARAIVREVSVLSPGVEPADPGAKVLTFHREEPKSPAPPTSAPEAKPAPKPQPVNATYVHRGRSITDSAWMQELERRMDWLERSTGRTADMEVVLRDMRREINGPTIDELYAETIKRRVAA
jgi:hypothetical protein